MACLDGSLGPDPPRTTKNRRHNQGEGEKGRGEGTEAGHNDPAQAECADQPRSVRGLHRVGASVLGSSIYRRHHPLSRRVARQRLVAARPLQVDRLAVRPKADSLGDLIADLAGDPTERARMSELGMGLIDGRGCDRVLEAVEDLAACSL